MKMSPLEKLLILSITAPLAVHAAWPPLEQDVRLTFPGSVAPTPVYENSGRVRLRGLYPGIDAVFYRNHGATEYDFVVAPNADATLIRIAFEGADSIELSSDGDIEVRKGQLVIEHQRPVAYQQSAGLRRSISCHYRLGTNQEVYLELGDYDRESVLVIDPVVLSSFSVGGGSEITGITTDSSGYTYVAGTTWLSSFPTTPGPLSGYHGLGDVFVMKLAPGTNAVIWAVLVGGSSAQTSAGIAVDAQGNVYVSGYTDSRDFPVTSVPRNSHVPGTGDPDLFVFKLNPQGTALVYSTLIGGSGSDIAYSLALAPDGHVAVVGGTTSIDFPVTGNAVQSSMASPGSGQDGVIVRLNASGVVDYSSYLGGPGDDWATDVAFDQTGDIYVAGIAGPFFPTLASSFAPQPLPYGGFVTRLDHASGQFVYSTYLPGVSVNDAEVYPRVSIRVDNSQNAYLAGPAEFVFPTIPGAFQTDVRNGARTAFVLELNPAGTELVFSTLIGGSSDDLAMALTLTGDTVTIAGITNSFDFPSNDHSMASCNVISIPSEFNIPYSTFVASFDHAGHLVTASEYSDCSDERVAGIATGPQGVLMAGAFFFISIDLSQQNPVQVAVVADAASLQIGPYSPLELVSIFGQGLGPKQGVAASPMAGYFPTQLAGTQLTFNGLPVPLLYVSDTQINAVVPGDITLPRGVLLVLTPAGVSAQFTTGLEQSTPAIFTVNQSGVGQGAILNQDGSPNSPANPAVRGSIISIYGTGGGQTTPAFGDGQIVPGAASLTLAKGLYVGIDGMSAPIAYAGTAPSLVNGIMQVNVQIPAGSSTGSAVPIIISQYPFLSQSGVTVAIK